MESIVGYLAILKNPIIIIPLATFSSIIILAVLILCLKLYRMNREISGATALVWRHPEHEMIDDEIYDKREELAKYRVENTEWLQAPQKLTFREQLPFFCREKKYAWRMHKKVDARLKQGEKEITQLEKQRQYLGISVLEFANIENPPGEVWFYKEAPPYGWLIKEKPIKWCMETPVKGNPRVIYEIKAYNPSDFVDGDYTTTSKLADALDWRGYQRILQNTHGHLLRDLAMGGLVLMGLASIIGMVFLSVFLQGG